MSQNQPSLGWIYWWTDKTNFYFLCLLGDKPAAVIKGYGGWEDVKRKRRRALTEWTGTDALVMEIPIMIDGFAEQRSIEHEIAELEKMAGWGLSSDEEPPLVHYNSAGVVPHDHHREPGISWVVEDVKWGDSDSRPTGERIRQAGTITLKQYIEDDSLSALSSAQKNRKGKGKGQQKKGKGAKGADKARYVIVNGDTLESIAAHRLGSAKRWVEIKKLNPKYKDPKRPLPAGQVLTMPK